MFCGAWALSFGVALLWPGRIRLSVSVGVGRGAMFAHANPWGKISRRESQALLRRDQSSPLAATRTGWRVAPLPEPTASIFLTTSMPAVTCDKQGEAPQESGLTGGEGADDREEA